MLDRQSPTRKGGAFILSIRRNHYRQQLRRQFFQLWYGWSLSACYQRQHPDRRLLHGIMQKLLRCRIRLLQMVQIGLHPL